MLIKSENFNLILLRVSYFDGYEILEDKFLTREVYDYEVEIFLESDGGVVVDGKYITFEKGSINFRVPGELVRGVPPYKSYIIIFDIAGNKNKATRNYLLGTKQKRQPKYNNAILNGIPNKIEPHQCVNAQRIITKIFNLNNMNSDFLLLKTKGLLYELLTELYESANPVNEKKINYNIYTNKAIGFMNKNFTHDIKMKDIAEHIGINVNYFQLIFRESVGITPKNYINKLRIERAKMLLATTEILINEVGNMCGFADNVYFSYFFKYWVNISPKEYRKIYNNGII